AELKSMYGRIQSAWRQDNGAFHWQITVPPNTNATVYIPAKHASQVKENGHPIEKAQGITFLRTENGSAVFDVKAGSYSFSSQLDKPT
ncbi:MAG TPA: alpha-L-rhamnosidase C-terminal domain-containing protein, partial [Anaerolineales bacterium]|nr:alpha-L-rhamnosidase C-terminal domain-containing protein [Anaerolineales bacterium]